MNYERLPIREKQVLGAICIITFCEKYKINHKSIDELFNHLIDILICESLSTWNSKGVSIDIVGRGDALSEELNILISPKIKCDFYELIDNVIEIGIIDLFGDFTNYPNQFLKNTFTILKKHNIMIKIPNHLFSELEKKSWGKTWSIKNYKKLLNWIGREQSDDID